MSKYWFKARCRQAIIIPRWLNEDAAGKEVNSSRTAAAREANGGAPPTFNLYLFVITCTVAALLAGGIRLQGRLPAAGAAVPGEEGKFLRAH